MSTQPNWKADFPIRQSEEHRVTRRQFVMFASCSAMVFGAAWLAKGKVFAPCVATEPQFIARMDEIPVGGSKLFRYPTEADPCTTVRSTPKMAVCWPDRQHDRCHVIPSRCAIRKSGCCHLDQQRDEPGPLYSEQRAVHAGATGLAQRLSGRPVRECGCRRIQVERLAGPACEFAD